MKEDLNLLPWEGVSLEEVLSLFTEDFPPIEIADGAPTATEQLPRAPVLMQALALQHHLQLILTRSCHSAVKCTSCRVMDINHHSRTLSWSSKQTNLRIQMTKEPQKVIWHVFYTCMLQHI